MTLKILIKSKKQQLINWEIQSKGSFKIEANFHLSIFIIKVCEIYLLYIFKIRGWRLFISFFPVPSTKIGTSLQNYCPNYWILTKSTPQKRWFFWSNPYKIEVVITSFIEMLELSNFGHMNTSTIQFESHD